MAVSKRLRHEIFRRDNFTCQSCGAKAPDVKLEPDHVVPAALGGTDHPSNLQTLCEDCNAGKSATPPDAALVAKVADDADRWARAMQAAADQLVGSHGERDKARAAFDAKWKSWSEGRPPLPRPQDWEASVDSFLRVGLPLPALLECVDIAMRARHVKATDVFTYMCGAAWKEVRKLQASAQRLLSAQGPSSAAPSEDDAPAEVSSRDEIVGELLDLLSASEKETVDLADRDMESLTEDGLDPIVEVIDAVLCDLRSETAWLAASAVDLLDLLPDGVGGQAMTIARHRLYDRYEFDNITRARFADIAMDFASHLLRIQKAERHLATVTPEARAEWIAYAKALHDTQPRDGWYRELGPDDAIIHASACLETVTESRRHRQMCQVRGEHIPACPRAAQYAVYIAELDCCAPDQDDAHPGHRVCEHHLTRMVDGIHTNRAGEHLTARSFKELDDE